MKTLLLTLLAATLLSAATYPQVDTPKDIVALVFQADAGVCQLTESWGNPCAQHVTVLLAPHNTSPGATFQVTLTYNFLGIDRVETYTKKVTQTVDDGGIVSVTFMIAQINLRSVTVSQ